MRLLFAILLGLFCSLPEHASGKSSDSQKPNVLFLICDDLNCDLGCYGHPLVKSPNIDRLARRGVRFENAHCQYSALRPKPCVVYDGALS